MRFGTFYHKGLDNVMVQINMRDYLMQEKQFIYFLAYVAPTAIGFLYAL